MPKFSVKWKSVGIDSLVTKKAIPKHRKFLSEEYLISAVLNATEDEITIIDAAHFIVELRRKKDGGIVTVLVWVHDQNWRYYIYRVHVTPCR